MKAYCQIRREPAARWEAFCAGLKAAGFEVFVRRPRPGEGRAGDVLVIWNRYLEVHTMACNFEREGGSVIVAENGYMNGGGAVPKFDVDTNGPKPWDYYALALHEHNGGRGRWCTGGPERFDALGVDLKPMKRDGTRVLVLPNRCFGTPGRIMPMHWAEDVAAQLRPKTKLKVEVRPHPGNRAPARPLSADLEDAQLCVIWHTSAGLHALAAGVPVLCLAPGWIGMQAAFTSWGETVQRAARADYEPTWQAHRREMFSALGWAQWRLDEIERGTPFAMLAQLAQVERATWKRVTSA